MSDEDLLKRLAAAPGGGMDDTDTGVAPRTDIHWATPASVRGLVHLHWFEVCTNYRTIEALIVDNRASFPDLYDHL